MHAGSYSESDGKSEVASEQGCTCIGMILAAIAGSAANDLLVTWSMLEKMSKKWQKTHVGGLLCPPI